MTLGREAKSSKATVNLFIDQNVLTNLKEEANSKGISLNSKINTILNKYVNFYRRTEETEHLIVAPRQWAVFLDMMDVMFHHNMYGIPVFIKFFCSFKSF